MAIALKSRLQGRYPDAERMIDAYAIAYATGHRELQHGLPIDAARLRLRDLVAKGLLVEDLALEVDKDGR